MLDGSIKLVPVTGASSTNSGAARLELDDAEGEPLPHNVLVDQKVVGQVASAYYSEVRQLLELGFALDMDFDPAQAVLSVSLAATAG